jgi:hypothetical protein
MDNDRASRAEVLAEVNRRILAAARDSITREPEWEFFCECGRPGCQEHVVLTVDAYTALHDGGAAVLAPGHRRSQVARAQQLLVDAEALRAQAEHQLKRARRILRDRRTR